jgi:PAS domain S-box-containing protein
LFLLCAIGLGLLATVQFTRPIAELQHGAEVIASGHYETRLHIETHDEIEHLAKQFNVMAEALEGHELEIQQHRTHLESMVLQRTQELSKEKATLQAVLDNVPSAFVLMDTDLCIRIVSTAFSNLTNIPAARVLGQSLSVFFIGNEEHAGSICQKALRNGTIETTMSEFHPDMHETRSLEYIVVPMKEQEQVSSLLLIITDITKRKRLEKQLVSTEKLVAAGEMSSIIAHEFRNALTSVKMIIQLFEEGNHVSSSEKKSLSVALNSIEHMESIVQELLDFAKPKLTNYSQGDLNNIIDECIAFVRPHLKSKNIRIKTQLDRSLQRISLDVSLMKEALINLLLNAIQAMDGQSGSRKNELCLISKRVRLRTSIFPYQKSLFPSSEDNIEQSIGLALPKGTLCAVVEIQDTGNGIPASIRNRIFDPFFTTKTNGTGLGLPMVQRTIGSHHGVITVKSRERKGTTFRIYLPYSYET